jgi:membrane protein involved in colicin uptake
MQELLEATRTALEQSQQECKDLRTSLASDSQRRKLLEVELAAAQDDSRMLESEVAMLHEATRTQQASHNDRLQAFTDHATATEARVAELAVRPLSNAFSGYAHW